MYEYTLYNSTTNDETIDFGTNEAKVLERHTGYTIIARDYID